VATLLYRLGRFSYRHAWRVIGVWVLVLVGILGGSVALGGQTSESFAIPGTESQNALDRLEAVFPSVAGASVQVVAVAPDGASVTDPEYTDAIEKTAKKIEKIDGVASVISPFSEYAGKAVADDDSMAIIKVQFDGPSTEVTEKSLTELQDTASIGEDAGMVVEFGGQVFQDNTFGITITEVFGVLFAGVVLFITFGSLVAAGMPLLSALIGVGIAIGGISAYSAFATVGSTAPLLALMIGLAVGIDYALFILSRHRTQLAAGEDPEESAAIAVGTAGSAVVFAGVTVIIALLGLLVVGIPFLSVMGVGAAFAVLVAIAIAVTLLPAFLGVVKGRLIPKEGSRAHRRAVHGSDSRPTMGLRWVKLVMKAPWVALIGVVAILGTLAIPALSLDLNLPDNGSEPAESTQRQAYDLVSEGFGAGFNSALVVEVDITQTVDIVDDLAAIGDRINALDDVAFVSQGFPDEGLDTAIIQVTPESAPDSVKTKDLVENIREMAGSIEKEFDTPIAVTGATAVGIDISNRLASALLPFGAVVVGLSIVLLMMVFRSVLVPVKAALGFLLSVVAAFGVVVAIFQWGWAADLLNVEKPGPILSFLPILLMAVLFGLAMDYEVFLVSGMREEFVKTGNARAAVEHGFANAARVVVAAALIMFFVFFAFVPEGSGAIKPIALGLAAGITFDAFLVRLTLVPAVMTILGRAAWWMPAWLARLLPNVDIEGEQLREHREAVDWAREQGDSVVSAEYLVAGDGGHSVGPISLDIPAGAIAIASGDPLDRRLLAATLAGRVPAFSGRAQIAGHPLPSEASRVSRLVALADIGGVDPTDATVTVGELLEERLEMTQPWYRMFRAGAASQRWLDRLNSSLAGFSARETVVVRASSTLVELPQLERALALSAIALAERTPVVMLDQLDSFASAHDETVFLAAIRQLAPATTTVVLGTPLPPRAAVSRDFDDRTVIEIDLYSVSKKEALR
jgi:RND superfamily putative drug exporter